MQSDLNIHEWENRLETYHDKELSLFLKFGWPLGYHATVPPTSVLKNHASAVNNINHVHKFIKTELQFKAILGPFEQAPFLEWCRFSPIMTRPKKESNERRIILDLSYPKGSSVNDGILTTCHFGMDITYSLPTIADFVEALKNAGRGAYMWKSDLTRAYRQLRADPLDSPLLGLQVEGKAYIDLCPPFGCRSSAAICQRVANALVFMMAKSGHAILGYLDDFAACHDTLQHAKDAYEAFLTLTASLGLKLASHKSSPPTTKLEWLGQMKISIPEDKLRQVIEECSVWLTRTKANKRMIQSIAGRIIYIANCIPPARKFTARILATLSALDDHRWVTLNDDFKADIRWFVLYAQHSNGVHLFSPDKPILYVQCDSSLFGGGGVAPPFCYSWEYSPHHMQKYTDIHHLEAINLIVAYQTLIVPQAMTPANVVIWTDNIASAWALTCSKIK